MYDDPKELGIKEIKRQTNNLSAEDVQSLFLTSQNHGDFLQTAIPFDLCCISRRLLGHRRSWGQCDEPEVEHRVGRRGFRGGAKPKGLSLRSFSIL